MFYGYMVTILAFRVKFLVYGNSASMRFEISVLYKLCDFYVLHILEL